MSLTRAEVLATVNACPQGATTKALAERLNVPRYRVGTAVSRLFAYGYIDKVQINQRGDSLWMPKVQQ